MSTENEWNRNETGAFKNVEGRKKKILPRQTLSASGSLTELSQPCRVTSCCYNSIPLHDRFPIWDGCSRNPSLMSPWPRASLHVKHRLGFLSVRAERGGTSHEVQFEWTLASHAVADPRGKPKGREGNTCVLLANPKQSSCTAWEFWNKERNALPSGKQKQQQLQQVYSAPVMTSHLESSFVTG